MVERVVDYFLTKPRRLMDIGYLLVMVGAGVILAGLIGHFATAATGVFARLGGHAGQATTLTELYPTLPTWWVPESILGGMPALLLSALGIWLNHTGRRLLRFMRRL